MEKLLKASTSKEDGSGHGSTFYIPSKGTSCRKSVVTSTLMREISPRRVFNSNPVECSASLPKLFKSKGSLQSLRPAASTLEISEDEEAHKEDGYKPRVLRRLEALLADKLFRARQAARILGPETTGYSPGLLESNSYRQAFDAFIHAFTTYRPLLQRIKKQYDLGFEDAIKAAQQNIHMRNQISQAETDKEKRVREARKKVREVEAQKRMEIAEAIKCTEVQIALSKAMAREAEDETHVLRLKTQEARKEVNRLLEESANTRQRLVDESSWSSIVATPSKPSKGNTETP